jgi:hypothetical protein
VDIEYILARMDTSEAELLCLQEDREPGLQKLRRILTTQPAASLPGGFRITYLAPALSLWLTLASFRDASFPTFRQLILIKRPIEDILRDHDKWLNSEAGAFSDDVRGLLRGSAHDLVSKTTHLPVPPPNKRFESGYLATFGGSVGDDMVTGLGRVRPSLAVDASTDKSMLKTFLLQSNVAGSTGKALLHIRAAGMLVGSGQWVEALRHLKSYAALPTPREDRLNAGLRCQNALMAVVCFGRLKCYELARRHAFKAVEEAVLARDDGHYLTVSLGVLAGIEVGRVGAATLTPKLLVFRAAQVVYSRHQPGRVEGGPSTYQLKSRNGYRLRRLRALTSFEPKDAGSSHPMFLDTMIKQRLAEREEAGEVSASLQALKIVEATIDATVQMIFLDILKLLKEASPRGRLWLNTELTELEDKLWMEAEQVAFGTGKPEVKHMGEFSCGRSGKMLSFRLDSQPNSSPSQYEYCRATLRICGSCITTPDGQIDLDMLRGLLGLPDEPLSFDPPASAISKYDAKIAAKEGASGLGLWDTHAHDPDDGDDVASGYLSDKMFWSCATNHFLAEELREDPMEDDIWRLTEKCGLEGGGGFDMVPEILKYILPGMI